MNSKQSVSSQAQEGNNHPTTPNIDHTIEVEVHSPTKITTKDKTAKSDNKGSESPSFKAYNNAFDIF